MILTPEQQALLDGKEGEIMAKIVKTLVMYGEAFGAERMVPVTSKYGHTVISFGLEVMKPVYDLYDKLIEAGLPEGQKFTADPKPLDPKVPSSLLDDLVFKKIMYTQQQRYEEQMRKLGITDDDDYTCACYLDQVGNVPQKGEVLSWAESSAVVYANSVLGARCNRNSGMLELMGSIAGFVPEFGLLTDEGRKATWIIELKCEKKPESGQVAGDGAERRGQGLSEGLRRGHRLQRRSGPLPHREPDPRGQRAGREPDRRGRPGLCDRRRRAPEGEGQLPRHLEEARRQARTLLCGLPPHEPAAAEGLGQGRTGRAGEKRPQEGHGAHGVHRAHAGHQGI